MLLPHQLPHQLSIVMNVVHLKSELKCKEWILRLIFLVVNYYKIFELCLKRISVEILDMPLRYFSFTCEQDFLGFKIVLRKVYAVQLP